MRISSAPETLIRTLAATDQCTVMIDRVPQGDGPLAALLLARDAAVPDAPPTRRAHLEAERSIRVWGRILVDIDAAHFHGLSRLRGGRVVELVQQRGPLEYQVPLAERSEAPPCTRRLSARYRDAIYGRTLRDIAAAGDLCLCGGREAPQRQAALHFCSGAPTARGSPAHCCGFFLFYSRHFYGIATGRDHLPHTWPSEASAAVDDRRFARPTVDRLC